MVKRQAQGKKRTEIIRCLKRHIAREIVAWWQMRG